MSELRSLLSTAVALAIIVAIAAFLPWGDTTTLPSTQTVATTSLPAAAARAPIRSQASPVATSSLPIAKKIPVPGPLSQASTSTTAVAVRTENPYTFPPLLTETLNADARSALVNIFCTPRGGSLAPISGSGVMIDPRGIILTNAHVAQYVLLSESSQVNLVCTVRTGAPATAQGTPVVLAMPAAWVQTHAKDIAHSRPQGTGEHDWALLLMTQLQTSSDPLPATFPFLQVDVRSAIGFVGDTVLAAGYPAEFVGGTTAQTGLYPVSSVSAIQQLLTFSTSSVDLISIGSVIEAQGGSSGGPVVNQWDRLIGIITTTSEGTTTAQRDLRALTMDYIDKDMVRELGFGLDTLPRQEIPAMRLRFLARNADDFADEFIRYLSH